MLIAVLKLPDQFWQGKAYETRITMSKNYKDMNNAQPLNKAKTLANLAKNVSEKTICYVLITCEKPNANGSMNVDLVFEGDKNLASHLIQSAKSAFEK